MAKDANSQPRLVRLKIANFVYGQPEIGWKEVTIKLNHFLREFGLTLDEFRRLREINPVHPAVQDALFSDGFQKFLSSRNMQLVRAPNGEFFTFNGNHLRTTLQILQVEEGIAFLHEDFWIPDSEAETSLSERMAQFKAYMVKNNLVRLVDRYGNNYELDELPRHPEDLLDNPFRSLTWILKKAHVFNELEIPFQEFEWSDFLQAQFQERGWRDDFKTDEEFMEAVDGALTILFEEKRSAYKKLSGYRSFPKKRSKFEQRSRRVLDRCARLLYDFNL